MFFELTTNFCFCPVDRSMPGTLANSSGMMSGDQLMPMCELGELSSMHALGSTSAMSKMSLKSHRASNNLNVVEIDNTSLLRRANDISLGECSAAGLHLASSSPYSPNVQPSLNLMTNNSASDPLLSTSALSSITGNTHRVNVTESEAAQRCNDTSPGECQVATGDGVHSPSPFYLSPTLNLSSSSSSSSESGVSIFSLMFFVYS